VLKSRWEDGLLHEEYGDEWAAWAARTGALIPRAPR
jgi:protein-S-isoprenylcysteine O-methyltransferase Ste14